MNYLDLSAPNITILNMLVREGKQIRFGGCGLQKRFLWVEWGEWSMIKSWDPRVGRGWERLLTSFCGDTRFPFTKLSQITPIQPTLACCQQRGFYNSPGKLLPLTYSSDSTVQVTQILAVKKTLSPISEGINKVRKSRTPRSRNMFL